MSLLRQHAEFSLSKVMIRATIEGEHGSAAAGPHSERGWRSRRCGAGIGIGGKRFLGCRQLTSQSLREALRLLAELAVTCGLLSSVRGAFSSSMTTLHTVS